MACVDVHIQHVTAVIGQQGAGIGELGQQRYAAMFLNGGKKRFGFLTEAEHACIIDIVIRLIMFQISFLDSKKNMYQAACDTCIGTVFSFQLLTEIGETPVCGQFFDNAVREGRVDIGILREAAGLLGKKLIMQRK